MSIPGRALQYKVKSQIKELIIIFNDNIQHRFSLLTKVNQVLSR
jgi:hypothetical protein